jgi:hypothetical protein
MPLGNLEHPIRAARLQVAANDTQAERNEPKYPELRARTLKHFQAFGGPHVAENFGRSRPAL